MAAVKPPFLVNPKKLLHIGPVTVTQTTEIASLRWEKENQISS